MTARRQHGGGAAFTLVELLVVISVMGILMAILIPATANARKKAQMAKCGSNLREIGKAVMQYGQDKGTYPLGYQQTPWTEWSYILSPYLGGKQQVPGSLKANERGQVIHCPTAIKVGNNLECNYSAHPCFLIDPGWNTSPVDHFPAGGIRYTLFKRPQDLVLMLDGLRAKGNTDADATFMQVNEANEGYNGDPARAEWSLPEDFASFNSEGLPGGDHWPHWRHGNAVNTVRLDCHVESLKLVGSDGKCEFKEKHVRFNY